jgi:dienelactone hydrolase
MCRLNLTIVALFWCSALSLVHAAEPATHLDGTEPLDWSDPIDVRIVGEAHRLLDAKTVQSVGLRKGYWKRDNASAAAYEASVEPNRERLRQIIGAVDVRLPLSLERFGDDQNPALVAETKRYRVFQVRWPVLQGIWGEGLLLEPIDKTLAQAVAIPDADQTPEQIVGLAPGIAAESQFARRLAENGFRVVVPVLIDRACTFSGNPKVLMTDQPHREWIYRQAYEMGRHIIGYEVQRVLSVVDWFQQMAPETPTAVAGYAEGGLVAFYAAAIDKRIDACLVSGYFNRREGVWEEPIYRNVWRLLAEFGDAEIASLIAPRGLVVEHSEVPKVEGPPAVDGNRRRCAAPGRLTTPAADSVRAEFDRIAALDPENFGKRRLIFAGDRPIAPGSAESIAALGSMLGLKGEMLISDEAPIDGRESLDSVARQGRQVEELTLHMQRLLQVSDAVRDEFFLNKVELKSADHFAAAAGQFRQRLWRELIGPLDDPLTPLHARSRLIYDEPAWTGYEVVFEVIPGLHAWGVLCVPKDLQQGERRPVVVCQHGLEGLPSDVIERQSPRFKAYQAYAARLAERGLITFAPFNLYRGEERFRLLQRKANPLGMSLFSIITRQHEQILRWLASLPFVDGSRIGFYGLSYGGKTAMRVPALLDGYCLSICSADFNDWVRKNVTVDSRMSYMYTHEWEMPEFNLGHTFNYAEMAYLIFPRPFMVERGHHDGVAPDAWVAYEFAKVRYLYDNLGLGDATEIEFFNGPHAINGAGTFDFLHRHLCWPVPQPTERKR